MPWWATVLTSIGSAIIGGIFTLIVGKRKLNFEKQKYLFELDQKANENKPRLEIEQFNSFANWKSLLPEVDCELIALGILDFKVVNGRSEFFYDKKALINDNLVYVEYNFINKGKTEIEDICFVSNLPKSMSIFDFARKDVCINEKLLNYDVWANKRYIKKNGTLKVRIYYIKNQIPTTNFGSPELVVWLRDVEGRYWEQVLNAPANEIEISRLKNYKEFKEDIDTRVAIECFKNPIMW